MIKLIIFDLDGVFWLIYPKEIHYRLLYAIDAQLSNIDKKYVINREEHISNTMETLQLLS